MFEKAGVECVPFNSEKNFTRDQIQENCNKMLGLVKEFSATSEKEKNNDKL